MQVWSQQGPALRCALAGGRGDPGEPAQFSSTAGGWRLPSCCSQSSQICADGPIQLPTCR